VRTALGMLVDAELTHVERHELRDLMSTAARVRGWLDSFDIDCARRARQLADAGAAEPPESLIGNAGRRSGEEASRISSRADALDEFGQPVPATSPDPASPDSEPADPGADNTGEDAGEAGGVDDADTSAGDGVDSFERALREGRISSGHVDAMAIAARRLDADARAEFRRHLSDLLAAALIESVATFTRRCRALAQRIVAAQSTSDADELDRQRRNSCVKRWVDKITGMHHTHLELDPIRDAQLWSIVNAHLSSNVQNDGNAKTPWMQMQVDAFVAAATGAPVASSGPADAPADANARQDPDSPSRSHTNADDLAHERRVPEIMVLTDYRTLVEGLHELSICETDDGVPLPVSTVRRLCCDAEIIPMMLGTDGVPLDAGRSVRTANRQQRRALRAMYRTCAHPDCTVAFSACKAHHIRWWWRHLGPTDLDNLIPLCERHHHLVHEGGWTLTMTPDRVTTWTRPDGTVALHGLSIDRTPASTPIPARTPAPTSAAGPQLTQDDAAAVEPDRQSRRSG
jgi:hypothetical protein